MFSFSREESSSEDNSRIEGEEEEEETDSMGGADGVGRASVLADDLFGFDFGLWSVTEDEEEEGSKAQANH